MDAALAAAYTESAVGAVVEFVAVVAPTAGCLEKAERPPRAKAGH